MGVNKVVDYRKISLIGFSFLSAYLLSFQFEGQVLYGLLDYYGIESSNYIILTILAHFIGLLSCGVFVKNYREARNTILRSILLCLILSSSFFIMSSKIWIGSLIITGYASGCGVASWGYLLKVFTPSQERARSCINLLIFSNILMVGINLLAAYYSPVMGLGFSLASLFAGIYFIGHLPKEIEESKKYEAGNSKAAKIRVTLIVLYIFIFTITINSGLMYQVIKPSFSHLKGLFCWYWPFPYIVSLILIRSLPKKMNYSKALHIAMAMIMASFIGFILLGRNSIDFIIVNSLFMAAAGILDLFWWSILADFLDYVDNPAKIWGIGLSANVLGILFGDLLGIILNKYGNFNGEVAIIGLTVVGLTLIILPSLNKSLVLLLENHRFLDNYSRMSQTEQTKLKSQIESLDPLTKREEEVLGLILAAKSNKEIAEDLFISENTVKTHARNIYSKYAVAGRVELISLLLKNQTS